MIKLIAAVVAGFVTIMLAVMGTTMVAAKAMLPPAPAGTQPMPTTPYIVVNLILGFAAAFLGGLVAQRISQDRTAVLILAGIILVMGVAGAVMTPPDGRQGQPLWYLWLLPVLGTAGVVVGGRAL